MGFTAEEAVAKLGDRDPEVRQAALVVLANLSPEDLATHAGAIVQRLRDDDAGVRDAARVIAQIAGDLLQLYDQPFERVRERDEARVDRGHPAYLVSDAADHLSHGSIASIERVFGAGGDGGELLGMPQAGTGLFEGQVLLRSRRHRIDLTDLKAQKVLALLARSDHTLGCTQSRISGPQRLVGRANLLRIQSPESVQERQVGRRIHEGVMLVLRADIDEPPDELT